MERCLIVLFIAVDNILTARTIGNHGDGEANLLFHKFNISAAVYGKVIVVFDAADVTVPARKRLQNRFYGGIPAPTAP